MSRIQPPMMTGAAAERVADGMGQVILSDL